MYIYICIHVAIERCKSHDRILKYSKQLLNLQSSLFFFLFPVKSYSKHSPKNQMFLSFWDPSCLLSLFVANISKLVLTLVTDQKVTKCFQTKYFQLQKYILGSISCVFIRQYPIPDFHFQTVKWKTYNWSVLHSIS